MKIEISQEDYEFLKELQHELNTQTTDGNAQPVFWGVRETFEDVTDGDYGGEPYITYDDGRWSVKEAIEEIEQAMTSEFYDIDDDAKEAWKEVDKRSAEDICDFMKDTLGWDNVYGVVYFRKSKKVSENTGAFLTKRACQQYIDKYGYNHWDPHTYAMTAFRNPELERLLNILKNLKFNKDEISDSDNQ